MDDLTTAEVQVIGSMLTSPAAVDEVTEILTGSDYGQHRHELLHDAIVALSTAGKPVDPISVGNALAEAEAINQAGGRPYLFECVQAVVSTTSAAYHARAVLDASMRRRVRRAGEQLLTVAQRDGDGLDIVNEARAGLDAITVDRVTDVPNERAVWDALDTLDTPIGEPTPWDSLTGVIGGWAPGMLYIGGARPGVGKTVLGIESLLGTAKTGRTGLMFSMEMPKSELYLRMLSGVGQVDGQKIQHRKGLTKTDHACLSEAAGHIAKLPLVVDDRSSVSLAQIRARVRATQRKSDVGLVVVDYLGLVKPPADAPKHDRRVQVDAIAQGLKNLARDVKVPILALAQLNRGIEGRVEKIPTLSDLRESGGIEAAADVVMLMHRDTREAPENLVVSLAKNRHGPGALLNLTFEGQHSRIQDRPQNQF